MDGLTDRTIALADVAWIGAANYHSTVWLSGLGEGFLMDWVSKEEGSDLSGCR